MGFRLLILTPHATEISGEWEVTKNWPRMLKEIIPDIEVKVCHSMEDAKVPIEKADAAFGEIVPELFQRAKKLRWIASPWAGPKAGYYHQMLIESDVVVTNTRGIFSDHISAHIMAFVLAFARGLHVYIPQQLQRTWRREHKSMYLPDATAIIVGLGGIGSETARLCSEFGMTVIGIDARLTDRPSWVAELHPPESISAILPRGDFVIVTVPETPETQGMFKAEMFEIMKRCAYFINVGRGATVVLDDLVEALRSGKIAGAGLDVFQMEPLPKDHTLWNTPGVLITPHVAAVGPSLGHGNLDERRTELFLDNCVRFDKARSLRNVVDKARWF